MIRLGHWFGLITVAGGVLVLAAYAFGIEAIWRPLSNGPATHPTSAILFILGGAAVASIRPMRIPPVGIAALLVVALVAAGRILEFATGFRLLDGASSFQPPAGAPVAVGWNSAVMFVLVPLSYLLRYWGRPRAGQIIAAAGMAPPLVALTGYLYGVAEFYGSMSLTTAIIGLFFSVLSASPRRQKRDRAGHMQPMGRWSLRPAGDRGDHVGAFRRWLRGTSTKPGDRPGPFPSSSSSPYSRPPSRSRSAPS